MTRQRLALGRMGEAMAREFLQQKGYEILDANVRFPSGEIDVVARDGDTLVIVEVRTRSNLVYGLPVESVTRKKQQKLRHLAGLYLNSVPSVHCWKAVRFDVVSIISRNNWETPQIQHVINAFW